MKVPHPMIDWLAAAEDVARSDPPRRASASAIWCAVFALLAAIPFPSDATTYFIRADGGDAAQCTGLANAPYPGSGSAQACGWKHPFIALPPHTAPRIAGGDTLIVQGGEYAMGIGAPGADACAAESARDCSMPSIPGGPSPDRPTRILGEGHDRQCPAPPELWANGGAYTILQLAGSSNVEVACLELTDHSPCIKSHNHAGNAKGETARCADESPPYGRWGENGIVASDSANVVLRDLNIHGLAGNGVHAGRLKDWAIERVRLHANGWAGWDGNVGQDDGRGSSNSGQIRFSGGEISWNGCGERYPDLQIFGCWAQQQGGYGDGLGTAKSGGDWVFEDVRVDHNTSDGLDLLYMDGSGSVTVRRVRAIANAGNQLKTAGPATIENSILIGDCAFFASLAGSNLGDDDHCRANGNTLSVSLSGDSLATIRNNTLTGHGDCLLITVGGGPSANVRVQNNAFIGEGEWRAGLLGQHQSTCGHYAEDSDATVSFESNLFWHVKDEQCPPGSVCGVDPMLGTAGDENQRVAPRPGSPLIDRAKTIPGLDHDFHHAPRPAGANFDIGAIEVQPAVPAGRAASGQSP